MNIESSNLSRRAVLTGGAAGVAGAATLMILPAGVAQAATAGAADPSWQTRPDLLPPRGKYVFGVYAGGGESMSEVATLLNQDVGLTTIYWNKLASPASRVQSNLNQGIVTRLELELTFAFGKAGEPVAGLWRRIANGLYDEDLRVILPGIGRLASICHEADLAPDEEGGYGGVAAGTPRDFADMWRHVANLARELDTQTLWFFNTSFKVDLWGENCTDEGSTGMYPGHKYVDFVGWDGFCWLNVPYHRPLASQRTPFGSMMTLFGRWDWYKRNFGEYGSPTWKPLMIGETACCEAEPPHQPANEWIDDMRTWLHRHPDVTHVIYFSVLYPGSHDRRLTGGPQKQSGARNAGRDRMVTWPST